MEPALLSQIYTCNCVAKSRHARFLSIKFTYIISLKPIKAIPHPLIPQRGNFPTRDHQIDKSHFCLLPVHFGLYHFIHALLWQQAAMLVSIVIRPTEQPSPTIHSPAAQRPDNLRYIRQSLP